MADNVDLTADLADGSFDSTNGAVAAPAAATPGGVPTAAQPAAEQPSQQPAVAAEKKGAKVPSLREQLTSAFTDPAGDPTDQANAQSNEGRPRRADGTFKSADEIAAEQQQQQQQQQQPAVAQFPRGMSPEEQQQFSALPEEQRQFVARTMEAVEATAARYAGYEQLEQLIGPRRQAWALNGMTEHQAVHQLLALSDFATQKPEDFVRYFAQQQGIDLEALYNSGGQPAAVDPNVARLYQEVQQLRGQLGQFTTGAQQQQHQNTVTEITAFAEEKGADGQPLRPYFQELGQSILPYVQTVRAENPTWNVRDVLNAAYDRACWATPTVREKLRAAEEAKRLAGAAATGQRARAAAASVTGAPAGGGGTSATAATGGAVRDILREQFAAAGATV